jgi:type II secretory ATPase GspE/PulE/Tfp pilus assembly ATPase PilB-like protein
METLATRPALATSPAIHWPPPPFFKFTRTGAAFPRQCEIELVDGTVLLGELLELPPTANPLRYKPAGGGEPTSIDLRRVQRVTLTEPVELIRDQTLMHDVGVGEQAVADERPCSLTFTDGSRLEAQTRGFVRTQAGVFLNLIHPESQRLTACFFPIHRVSDLQIGPRLGDALTGLQLATDDAVSQALGTQARMREERLGEYLAERAIVSASDLQRALRAQEKRPSIRLGEFLMQAGLISEPQLDAALKLQAKNRQRRLGEILVDLGVVSVRQVQVALSDKLGIPYVNVRDFVIEPATLALVSPRVAIQNQVLPLLRAGDTLVVAVENPLGEDYARVLRFTTGLRVVPVIASPSDLALRIAAEYPTATSTTGGRGGWTEAPAERPGVTVAALAAQAGQQAPTEEKPEPASAVADNALVRLINKIIIEAHAQGASDIHIEANPRTAHTRIRLRKDGELEDYLELQPSFRQSVVSRLKVMAQLDISERRIAQDGKIEFGRFGPLAIELRLATIPTANGLEDAVLRILGGNEPIPLHQLGLAERDLAQIRGMIERSHGLIVACGPTGSGKTTTLHSLLSSINRPNLKIWTAEDPVEITQPGLRQVQINAAIGWTFAAAMRSFLRADPDVIMVGEMRDVETARTAIEASLTGHLVLSTLHTNSAAESVVRLLDLGMDPFNFADAIVGVLAQRLVRKLCPRCRAPRAASEAELLQLVDEYCAGTTLHRSAVLADWRTRYTLHGSVTWYEAAGCETCKNGYRGRIGIYELLAGTPPVKDLIRARGTVPQLVDAARHHGMRTLRQDAIEKVLAGAIDLGSARAASS